MDRDPMGQLALRKSSILGTDLHVWVPLVVGLLVICFVYYVTRK
jgi:hypothetical protein